MENFISRKNLGEMISFWNFLDERLERERKVLSSECELNSMNTKTRPYTQH